MTKTNKPFVSFIIVCWNNQDLLKECFESIYKQSYKHFDIIMVDNGSSDNSVAFTKEHFPLVRIIEAGENLRFAVGNNRGIELAFQNPDCQYVALVNTDARIDPDWLECLVGFATKHPKTASLQTPTVDYYDHSFLDSRGLVLDHQGRAMQLGYRDKKPELRTRKLFGVNAAAAVYSRDFLEAQPFGTDYFDSEMNMYLEDVDLAARAVIMGWDNWLVNKSCAYHMGSATSGKNPGFSVFMVYRNNAYLILKNMPLSIIVRILPGLVATDLQSIYRLFRGKNYIAIKSIVRGRSQSLLHFMPFLAKRKLLKKYRVAPTKVIWQQMSNR
jgi:GT2 family glycosyltransferase